MVDPGFLVLLDNALNDVVEATNRRSNVSEERSLIRTLAMTYIMKREEYRKFWRRDMAKRKRFCGYAVGCIRRECLDETGKLRKRAIPVLDTKRSKIEMFKAMYMDKFMAQSPPIAPNYQQWPKSLDRPAYGSSPVTNFVFQADAHFDARKVRDCMRLETPKIRGGNWPEFNYTIGMDLAANCWKPKGETTMKLKTKELTEKLKEKREEFVKLSDAQLAEAQKKTRDAMDWVVKALQDNTSACVDTRVEMPSLVNKSQHLAAYDSMIAQLELCAEDSVDVNTGDLLTPEALFPPVLPPGRAIRICTC